MNITPRRIVSIAIAIVGLLIVLLIVPQLFTNVDASEIIVIQRINGDLDVISDAGWKWQGMGKITRYKRREQYSFSSAADQGKAADQSINTGFNDGGAGRISGVVSWEMPTKPSQVIRLHKEYNNFETIDQQLIRPMLEKVIFSAGATMSSIESSSERRPEITQTIDDQLQNGPYLTKVVVNTIKDTLTGLDKSIKSVQVVIGPDGKVARASESSIKEYGITVSPVTINDINYEGSVKAQIAERQKSTQAVQLSQAAAIRATQDAITTEQQGKANAAKAKWEQEVVNARTIADAQAKVTIAEASVKEAEAFKKSEILRGEGEAGRKSLVMAADGALEMKLDAIVRINELYASAIEKAQPGAWSPSIVMGGSSLGNAGTNATNLVDLMTAKTAKELGVDLSVRSNSKK